MDEKMVLENDLDVVNNFFGPEDDEDSDDVYDDDLDLDDFDSIGDLDDFDDDDF